jgi:hypothetical protein
MMRDARQSPHFVKNLRRCEWNDYEESLKVIFLSPYTSTNASTR